MDRDPSAFGIRDTLAHEIPQHELNNRAHEIAAVVELLLKNPLVILTAEHNGAGKSTFAVILRHLILSGQITGFDDCLFMTMGQVHLAKTQPRRQNRFQIENDYSYPDFLEFDGLLIFDEVNPDQFPLLTSLTKPKVLAIIQPNFLVM